MKHPGTQMAFFFATAIIFGLATNGIRQNPIPLLAKPMAQAKDIPGSSNISDPDTVDSPVTKPDVIDPFIQSISLKQAKTLHNQGVNFIDARDNEYFTEGHIAGALPSDNFMEMTFQLDMRQGRDEPVVTYCDGDECGSSEDLAYDLQAAGFIRIYVFSGGWSEWTAAGYPVESGMVETDDLD